MDSHKAPRTVCSDTRNIDDILSNLPEAIIHHIFSFLETVDLVRTSALSRKWRYLWTSIPYLHFDIQTTWKNPLKLFGTADVACEKFRNFVNWVLLCQSRSTHIQRFYLSCDLKYCCDEDTIFRWLNIAAQRNVQELDLTWVPDLLFQLPLCLVGSRCLDVLKLNLENGQLKLPRVIEFSWIKTLHLAKVDLLDDDEEVVCNFISCCRTLENLKIKSCMFSRMKVLHIIATSLKSFALVEDPHEDSPANGLSKIELKVDCPNLESFVYIAHAARNVSFQHASSLEKAFISVAAGPEEFAEEVGCILRDIATKVCNAKILNLCSCSIWDFNFVFTKLGCFSTSLFCNLRFLKLLSCDTKELYGGIICLLKCSPILENLIIDFEEAWNPSEDIEMKDGSIACLTSHLKIVELNYIEDIENHLELIRFLLKNGNVLEKIVVAWLDDLEEMGETKQEVMEFPRTSATAQLVFLQSGPRGDFSEFYDYEI